MKTTVLIVGGAGYIGSVLTTALLQRGYKVKVLDRLFFGAEPVEKHLNNSNFELIKGDIRYVSERIFKDTNAVINLAAISNDPSCELDSSATRAVNYKGTVRVAKLAKKMGVDKFVFSSSCSVYGCGADINLTEESALSPLSLYALTKVMAEKEILKLGNNDFIVTILRNATVYGISKRMRFDLVVNMMTLNAFKNKKIHIIGGGLQWRPNIHVQDVCNAFIKVLESSPSKVQKQIFNVGSKEQNYQVIQIANMVKNTMPDIVIEKVPSDPERRDYNVNFDKITNILGYSTGKTVVDGILEIKEGLERGIITDDIKTRTLDYYKYLLEANKIIKSVSVKGKIF
ncbi:SDR family oxidoreductase [bacterium]|nr:SDR family oxidoreductase [bacterium]